MLVVVVSIIIALLYWYLSQNIMDPGGQVSYVSGFFNHDQQPTGPESGFRATTLPNLGIIERPYDSTDGKSLEGATQWERFEKYLQHLNSKPDGPIFKVLYVGRHGEGLHNVKERERHWARLNGDGNVTWLDAQLTEKGRKQAFELAAFWEDALQVAKIPAPERYFTSPLARALETARLAYSGLPLPTNRRFEPIVKEELREIYGVHTCDRRSRRSWIASNYPGYVIEPGLSEEDQLWMPDRRETQEERTIWLKRFLGAMFEREEATFMSLTAHSGVIRALYRAIGHPDVWLAAGAVVPILVRRNGPMTNAARTTNGESKYTGL